MDPTEEHFFDWGNNLVQLRQFDRATEAFSEGIARHPQSARLHVGLGIAQYSHGQYADAVRSFSRAADLAPSDPRPPDFLGEMYGVAPELAQEITERLARFVQKQPDNALAHYYYAMSLWKGQSGQPVDMRQVETLLRRAVTLEPTFAKGFLELGTFLAEQQRDAEAIEQLRQAAQLAPTFPEIRYRLARAYRRTGQTELAAEELRIFEELKARAKANHD